jgi:hypothetical protein
MLVNNAGIMALPELTRTPQGRELQFAVNFLGHFVLTVGLHGAIARAEGARVVSVSSNAHLYCPVVFDDLDHRFRFYNPIGAYGESKTADVLPAVDATRRRSRSTPPTQSGCGRSRRTSWPGTRVAVTGGKVALRDDGDAVAARAGCRAADALRLR